jgi:hypothetical protein
LGIDLSYRPETYWPTDSLRQAVLGNIKGEVRRQILLKALKSGDADFPPEGLLKPTLEPGLRDLLGKIHPMFMGGEYLPDYLPEEVEIARVSMKSTTGDVISVRAGHEPDGLIQYRVVDEYSNEFRLPVEESELPLTTGNMIQLLDETSWEARGLVMSILEMNCEQNGGDGMRGFLSVSSDFYPELADHYRQRCNAFLDHLEPEHEEENE